MNNPIFQAIRRALLVAIMAVGFGLVLTACGDKTTSFKGSDITGSHLGQKWSLTGMDGKTYTPEDFNGKVTLVLFGFTQCPDVCPTSLAELAQVMKLLGDLASRVQVLMISVDPERDTPEVLRAYVSAFDPRFMGLTGTPEQIKIAAAAFKAYYARAASANGNYNMDHSANFYLLDAKGESRVLLSNNTGAENIAHDIRALLR
jgi:protein SCO1/2